MKIPFFDGGLAYLRSASFTALFFVSFSAVAAAPATRSQTTPPPTQLGANHLADR